MRTAVIVVGLLAAAPLMGQDEQKAVKEVLERAVKAAGGENTLKAAGAFTLKVKGQVDPGQQKIPVEGGWSLRGLNRFRWDAMATVENRNQNGAVIGHGEKSWLVGDDGKANPLPKELSAALLLNVRTIRMVQNPLLLRDKNITLASLGELKLDGRELVGIKVSSKGFPDVDLFYDKKTGHPVKAEFRVKDLQDGQEAAHVLRFEDSKEANGLTHFTRLKWLRDDKQHLELEFSDVKAQETLDDSVFALPK